MWSFDILYIYAKFLQNNLKRLLTCFNKPFLIQFFHFIIKKSEYFYFEEKKCHILNKNWNSVLFVLKIIFKMSFYCPTNKAPPSTGNNWPVIKDAESEIKYSIAADVSLHSPALPTGYKCLIDSKKSSACSDVIPSPFSKIGVRIHPGLSALHRIPSIVKILILNINNSIYKQLLTGC